MKKYLVIAGTSGKDELEYVIETEVNDKREVFTLRHHNTDEVVLRITDTGDGLILDKKVKKIDYSQQMEILMLLDFMNRSARMKLNYRFVNDEGL